jgi:phenylalanyl-tRNA synthetase beta chain
LPTVTLNKTVFEKLVGKELPLEELKDRISMLGTDLESIENDEIHVEIFPNRPDLLSEQGFARAFSSFIGIKPGLRKYEVQSSGQKVIVDSSVTMRPYTACAIVRNLSLNDERIRELMQVQEKLATTHGRNRKKSAYGIYPLNPIVFPINYIAKNSEEVKFKPLGFDNEVVASEIPENHPKGKAFAHLTKGWKKYPFFIDAADNVMCMLPFTNSHDTGKVDETTKDVFVECTGNDLDNVQVALNILVTTLADMGGEIYTLEIEYPDKKITTPNLEPTKMKFDLNYINQRLGLSLSESDAKTLLEKMGFGYENDEVLIPSYRADILHQVDFAEDIAIAYGYENFQAEIPQVATIGESDPLENFVSKLRDILVGVKLLEAKNYHITTSHDLNEKMLQENKVIELLNAVGEHNTLRNSIIPGLLKNLSHNQHHEYPQNLFEVGKVFTQGDTETGVQETQKMGVTLCHEKTDFTEIKQILGILCESLGLQYAVTEHEQGSCIMGRSGQIIVNDRVIGFIGEIHPQVLTNWDLTVPVVVLELNVEMLQK